MQLPLDWYVYIIPGSLFLVSTILLLLDDKLKRKIYNLLKENNLLALPIIIIFSFIIGVTADGFIHLVISDPVISLEDKIITENSIDPLLIKERDIEYSRMAFGRLLWISFLILIITSLITIFKERLTQDRTRKWIIGICIPLIFIGIIAIFCWCNDKQVLWNIVSIIFIIILFVIGTSKDIYKKWVLFILILSIEALLICQWYQNNQAFKEAKGIVIKMTKDTSQSSKDKKDSLEIFSNIP
jgi:cytochrome bd-type quinol oxidase subunit 2